MRSRLLLSALLILFVQRNHCKVVHVLSSDSIPIYVEAEDKIVGGVESVVGEFPYIISIQFASKNSGWVHICGGAIVTSSWIVTAGHCSILERGGYRIVAGAYDLFRPNGTEQIRGVDRIVTNPHFDLETVDYDVAVMQVDPPFELSDRVQLIGLPEREFTARVDVAETAGWGLLHKDDTDTPAILQKITLPLISNEQCEQIYTAINLTITDRMLCAGYNEGESVCNGDSGGPLLCSSVGGIESDKNVLCGLVSWGIPCAVEGYPAVFTRVTSVLDFIREYVLN